MSPAKIAYHLASIQIAVLLFLGAWYMADHGTSRLLCGVVAVSEVFIAMNSLGALRRDKP